MHRLQAASLRRGATRTAELLGVLLCNVLWLFPQAASALPVFARQTGQNCVACHAGGQFPELTNYGRMFKLTGYTIGKQTLPFAVMAVGTYAKLSSTTDAANGAPKQTYAKDGTPLFASGSLFIAGKITDNIGSFVQITYDNYASQSGNGDWHGHTSADNMDIRYADHIIDGSRDLIYGVTLNNNPSVSDPWNTAPAWMQYVPPGSPGAYSFVDANAPYPGTASDGGVAGLTAYLLWNKSIYGEIGTYRTADQLFSFMTAGTPDDEKTHLQGNDNPYWRLAYTHEWGPNNIMVGTSGMIAHVFDGSTKPSDHNAYQRIQNVGVDTQYQYLLDPHTVTAQLAYMQLKVDDSTNGGGGSSIAKPDVLRGKVSYVYQARYGGALAFFDQSDSKDSTQDTRGLTYEVFWTPVQYVRVGAQYTAYDKFAGASRNYDGYGRNASDNDTLFMYVWAAY
jgi:hypothetical protein